MYQVTVIYEDSTSYIFEIKDNKHVINHFLLRRNAQIINKLSWRKIA